MSGLTSAATRSTDRFADDVRLYVFGQVAETARVPQPPQIAEALGRSTEPEWRRHTVEEAEGLLTQLGLIGPFWNLRG
jgi:hypothetical protein